MSKKTVVVYKSKYGSTRRYAEYIAKTLECDLLESHKTKVSDLEKYDCIIYGGALYAVGIAGIKLITRNFDRLKDKELIVFSVGASPANPQARQHVVSSNFSNQLMDNMRFFMLRGAFNYNKLSIIHKFMMNMLKANIKSKKSEELTQDESGLLSSFENPVDWVKYETANPIIEYVNNLK